MRKYRADPPHEAEQRDAAAGSAVMFEAELVEYRLALARLRLDWELLKFALKGQKAGFDPAQPRVPAGNPDGGQWTDEGGSGTGRVRLASTDKPSLGHRAMAIIAAEVAKRVLDAYRTKEGLWDLFRRKVGAVTYTEIDGKTIYGSNSSLSLYRKIDRDERDEMIARYVEAHPEMEESARRRKMPVNAFGHAETNVLLRAAREYGGTLEGQTLRVFGDRILCNNCEKVLPFVGMQLGNPKVTFFDSDGEAGTIQDGVFHKAPGR